MSAQEVLSTMRARAEAAAVLRAQFSAVATVGQGQREANGVLLVRQPDAVRLRLFAPFGVTLLDYTRVGDMASVWTMTTLPPDADLELLAGLGADDARAVDTCEFFLSSSGVLIYRCATANGRRDLWVEARTATLRYAVDVSTGIGRSYDDYRFVDGIPLPHEIRISKENASVEVTIDRYEVNPPLNDQAFVPPVDARRLPSRSLP